MFKDIKVIIETEPRIELCSGRPCINGSQQEGDHTLKIKLNKGKSGMLEGTHL